MKKNKTNKIEKNTSKIKILKLVFLVVTLTFVAALVLGGIHVFKRFGVDPEAWVEYIRSFGAFSFLALLFFQIIQVFVAIIPGEVIEIVSGLLFNPFLACVLIYLGVSISSFFIFFMVKKLGKRFSRIFVSEEKLSTLRFINTKEKLSKTIFIMYLIPGTPKDLFTYFFPLTPIKFSDFIFISSIARFPSVISSVIGGNFIAKEEYLKAFFVFLFTTVISIVGALGYEFLKKAWAKKKPSLILNHKKRVLKLKTYKLKKAEKISSFKAKRTFKKLKERKKQ